jgi:hypothetical protein
VDLDSASSLISVVGSDDRSVRSSSEAPDPNGCRPGGPEVAVAAVAVVGVVRQPTI